MSGRRKKLRPHAGHQTPLIPHPAADVEPDVTDPNQSGKADQASVASAISATFAAVGQLQQAKGNEEPASPPVPSSDLTEPAATLTEAANHEPAETPPETALTEAHPAPAAAAQEASVAEPAPPSSSIASVQPEVPKNEALENEPFENKPLENEPAETSAPKGEVDVPAVRTAGAYLQQLREQQDLTLEQAALRLRVSVPQLQALEHNEWGNFPSVRYARALARSYCRGLGEPAAVVDAVLRLMPPAEHQPGLHAQKPLATSALKTRRPLPRWWLAALALLVIAIVIAVWPRRPHPPAAGLGPTQENTAALDGASAAAPLAMEASHGASAAATALTGSQQPHGASVPSKTGLAASQQTVSGETTAAVSEPALLASAPSTKVTVGLSQRSHRLTLQVGARSWVGVSKLDGHVIVDRFAEQETIEMELNHPVTLVLGNASGTRLLLDGKPISGLPAPRSNVLRVQLR